MDRIVLKELVGHMTSERSVKLRSVLFRAVVVLVLAALGFRLWRLQIVRGAYYQDQAERNRFRLVSTDALRGVIYDRYGEVLVRNVPSYSVAVMPADLPVDPIQRARVLQRLGDLLPLPAFASQTISGTVALGLGSPYDPVRIQRNVSQDIAFTIEESHLELPGVSVIADPVREYPAGPVTAHIMGYVGLIPAEQAEHYEALGYDIYRERAGLTGVEATYESYLHGRRGRKHIEVDIAGRELRAIGVPQEAVPGNSLVLTLDLDLQQGVERVLMRGLEAAKSKAGAAIVMNPNTGEILAMVSIPSYDNNLFATGISEREYSRLLNDPLHPLVNHAVAGQYPPGSAFKFITALAGLEEKIVSRDTRVTCTGAILVPNRYYPDDPKLAQEFKCWVPTGHGSQNIIEAMGNSCDVFFYLLGGGYTDRDGVGVARLSEWARSFGLGSPTGVELPGEAGGLIPTSEWKVANIRELWVTGDTYNMSIGQGYVLLSPLQLANAISTVANGGTVYRPMIVREVRDATGKVVVPFAPKRVSQLPASAQNLGIVREGLVAASSWGTGFRATPPGLVVAGKTGTAEYPGPRDKDGHLPTHAWYTSFAPADKPEISVTVLVEGGGDGALAAAPVANDIYRYYFQK